MAWAVLVCRPYDEGRKCGGRDEQKGHATQEEHQDGGGQDSEEHVAGWRSTAEDPVDPLNKAGRPGKYFQSVL